MVSTPRTNLSQAEVDMANVTKREHLEYGRLLKNHQTQCPSCGKHNTATIMYGLPSFSTRLEQEIEKGLTVLGGCCSTGNSPDLFCNECGHEWKNYGWPSIFPIADSRTGLVWAVSRVPMVLSYDDALNYVQKISVDDYAEWRLPTKAELWTLIDTGIVSDYSNLDTNPLRKPYNYFCHSHIHTGECVLTPKQEVFSNYVMDVRNGRIFPCPGLNSSVFAVWKTPKPALYKRLISQQELDEQ